ncbi:unnamed protein product [Phaeothamnion confervicola]
MPSQCDYSFASASSLEAFCTMSTSALGVVASLCSYSVGLAPLPSMIGMNRLGNVGDRSALPFVAMFCSGMLWSSYGVFSSQVFPLATTNLPICLFGEAYCCLYIAAATGKAKRRAIWELGTASVFVLAIILLTMFEGPDASSEVTSALGMVACAGSVALYGAPLLAIHTMVTTRSPELLCLPLTFALAAAAGTWTAFGLLTDDVWVTITNGVGLALAALQLLAYFYVRRVKAAALEVPDSSRIAAGIFCFLEGQPLLGSLLGNAQKEIFADVRSELTPLVAAPMDGSFSSLGAAAGNTAGGAAPPAAAVSATVAARAAGCVLPASGSPAAAAAAAPAAPPVRSAASAPAASAGFGTCRLQLLEGGWPAPPPGADSMFASPQADGYGWDREEGDSSRSSGAEGGGRGVGGNGQEPWQAGGFGSAPPLEPPPRELWVV